MCTTTLTAKAALTFILTAGILLLNNGNARADHETPYITVYPGGYISDSPTAPGYAEAVSVVRLSPGNNSVIPAKKFETLHAVSFKDMLASAPGVEAQPRFGEEVRLSIRGSGLSRSFHLRGINILQDGIPLNLADGSGDFQEIDPLLAQYIEVYRGSNALRFGAANLGGAINVVTPTGATSTGTTLRAEAGSNGTFRFNVTNGQKFDNGDSFVSVTRSVTQGYRDQSDENKLRFSGNTGYKFNDKVETRFYLTFNDLDQEVPSTLSLYNATHNPRAAAPINLTNDYQRNIRSLRFSNKTAFSLDGGGTLTTGFYFNKKTLYHPIFQVIDQHSTDLGTFARLQDRDTTIGINLNHGLVIAKQFVNTGGIRGALTADNNQIASNIELYGEQRWHLTEPLSLITGAQTFLSRRSLDNNANANASADKTYYGINPKLGLLYEPRRDLQIFGNVSHSAEPPTFGELVQAPVVGFVPLDPQKAWTAELGTRLQRGGLHVDATLYRSWLKGELLNFTTTPSVPAATFNAGNTIHQGIELGVGAHLAPRIQGNLTYTYNDFFFDGDAQYRDNDLAGAPPHTIHASIRYDHPDGWFIEPSLEWVPIGGYVDYANTLRSSNFAVVNANAGIDLGHGVKLFLDARNLMNEKYAATYSTVTNARTANTDVFYPGEGRAFFTGLSVKF
ncbi:MAG: TonB-dependent receptor [Micavibrio sp.]|nr:TonB-dependent receptor [Micavibrio sp.]